MSFSTDIVILSDIPKEFGPDIKVIVGLPSKDPWSLAFGHQKIFADNLDNYDLFIYSEDDTLIREKNIISFLEVTKYLPDNEIVGLFRFEGDESGRVNYPEIHGHFHWDPQSVRTRGEYTLAYFTGEHSACYIVTQKQLRSAINSGGFLVEPHEGIYDLACTASTDVYTQCGIKRLICISHIDEFLIHHLPNKYIGSRYGVDNIEFSRQIEVLLKMQDGNCWNKSLFETETKLKGFAYSKDFYEPVNPDIVAGIPKAVRNVLSIGCGSGATEGRLVEMGMRVIAVPLDCVISSTAAGRGVEIINGDFALARNKLSQERFDCLLLQNILHLVEDPVKILSTFGELLEGPALVYIVIPNMFRPKAMLGKFLGDDPIGYERNGAHFTSHRVVKKWLKTAGMKHQRTTGVVRGPRAQKASRLTFGLIDSFLYSEMLTIARK